MLLLVRGFGWEVDRVVDLLVLQMRRRVLGTPGRLDSLFLNTLVMAFCFDRGPLVRGHYSFVAGRLMSSIVSGGNGLALSDRHTICSRSRTGDFVCCLERGFAGHDPSI